MQYTDNTQADKVSIPYRLILSLMLTNISFGVSMSLALKRKNAMFIFVDELNNRAYSMRRDMYAWGSNTKVLRYVCHKGHQNPDETRELLTDWIYSYSNNETYNWAKRMLESMILLNLGIKIAPCIQLHRCLLFIIQHIHFKLFKICIKFLNRAILVFIVDFINVKNIILLPRHHITSTILNSYNGCKSL